MTFYKSLYSLIMQGFGVSSWPHYSLIQQIHFDCILRVMQWTFY